MASRHSVIQHNLKNGYFCQYFFWFPNPCWQPLGLSLTDADFSDEKGFYGGDHAFRYSNSLGDLDFGINGFYGTAREPIILVDGNNSATPYYPDIERLAWIYSTLVTIPFTKRK